MGSTIGIKDGNWQITVADGMDCPGLMLHLSGEMTADELKLRIVGGVAEVNNLNTAIRRAGF